MTCGFTDRAAICLITFAEPISLMSRIYCTSKRYSGLTVDYREYFKLTIDFYFLTAVAAWSTDCLSATPRLKIF